MKSIEGTIAAAGTFMAGFLCGPDKQCVIFIEEFGFVWKIFHEVLLELIVADIMVKTEMPLHDPPGVCVNHESRQIKTIEEDTVGSFRANAFHLQD